MLPIPGCYVFQHRLDFGMMCFTVCGLGFGMISGIFSLVNVLSDSLGPGTIGLRGGSDMFFFVSAFHTLCFILLHTFWSVVFFNALDRRNVYGVVGVLAAHLVVSSLVSDTDYVYV